MEKLSSKKPAPGARSLGDCCLRASEKIICDKGSSHVALVVKNSPANAGLTRDMALIPGLGRSPWRRKWWPTPLAWRIPWILILMSYSPWGHKESGTTDWLNRHTHIHITNVHNPDQDLGHKCPCSTCHFFHSLSKCLPFLLLFRLNYIHFLKAKQGPILCVYPQLH